MSGTKASKALEKSIEVWGKKLEIVKRNKGKKIEDSGCCDEYKIGDDKFFVGGEHCPLCIAYGDYGCDDCPIEKKHGGCEETPYDRVSSQLYKKDATVTKKLIDAVKAEVKMLQSLLVDEVTVSNNPTGADLIKELRVRQGDDTCDDYIDDDYDGAEDDTLAFAAICYASPTKLYVREDKGTRVTFVDPWPWSDDEDERHYQGLVFDNYNEQLPDPAKYTVEKRIDLLVQAGAYIAAEIDRLQKKSKKKSKKASRKR